jgi:hypothetical protein
LLLAAALVICEAVVDVQLIFQVVVLAGEAIPLMAVWIFLTAALDVAPMAAQLDDAASAPSQSLQVKFTAEDVDVVCKSTEALSSHVPAASESDGPS